MGSNRFITGREQEEHKMAKVTTETVKVKITKHPRAMYYDGATKRDHMLGMVTYLNTSPKVPDERLISRFIKKLRVGDIVGVEHNQYRVEEITEESFTGVNIKTNAEYVPNLDKLSVAIGSGFAEILYRKGKPYGIKLSKEITLKITDHTKQSAP